MSTGRQYISIDIGGRNRENRGGFRFDQNSSRANRRQPIHQLAVGADRGIALLTAFFERLQDGRRHHLGDVAAEFGEFAHYRTV